MTIITLAKTDSETYPKNSLQRTIDGRSRKAIMAIALKLNGKPRIIDWPLAKSVKNLWQ